MYPFSSIAKKQRVGPWMAPGQQRQGQGRVPFPHEPREETPFAASGRAERPRQALLQETRNERSPDCPFPLRIASPSELEDDRSSRLRGVCN